MASPEWPSWWDLSEQIMKLWVTAEQSESASTGITLRKQLLKHWKKKFTTLLQFALLWEKKEHIKDVSLFYVVTSLTARIFTLALITSHSELFNNFLDCCSVSEFFHYTHHFHSVEVCSDQISGSVVSDSLQPRESQHARPPYPSPTPGVHSDSSPSSLRCHPAISSSVVPFSSCPQSLPASESFPMSQLFASGGQGIGTSASASVFQWIFRTDLL